MAEEIEKPKKAPKKQYNKWSQALADKIIELYETGKFTILEICKQVDCNKDSYYQWMKDKPYLQNGIDNVRIRRLNAIADRAESGLMKIVDVFEYDEKKTEYENVLVDDPENPGKKKTVAKVKGHSVTRKIIMPNARAIEYALNNVRKEDWKNTSHIDHTSGGDSFSFASFLTNPDTQLEDNNDTTSSAE